MNIHPALGGPDHFHQRLESQPVDLGPCERLSPVLKTPCVHDLQGLGERWPCGPQKQGAIWAGDILDREGLYILDPHYWIMLFWAPPFSFIAPRAELPRWICQHNLESHLITFPESRGRLSHEPALATSYPGRESKTRAFRRMTLFSHPRPGE